MKQKISRSSIVVLIIFLTLEMFLPNIVLGTSSEYTIESYNINMIVNENNTFDITETIDVNFTSENHVIYKKIPLRNTVKRLDGTKSNNTARISNIQVSEIFKTYNENEYKVIKIGDASKNFTGRQTYTIKYTYNIGKDPLKNEDELYFNLIGDEWMKIINNVSFSITMPKSFDETKLGFLNGRTTYTNSSNITYTVNGNTIKGTLNTRLYPTQALTVRLALPEGYFVGASNNYDYIMLLQILTSIVFVMIAYILWKKYGKDGRTVQTDQFYPPEGLNSADVGFVYKGYSKPEDIVSLLIYLANKGYLKIEEYEEKSLKVIKSKKFKIIKVKEYDGENKEESAFFYSLFESKNEVTKSDLYNKFYAILEIISKNINRKENQEKIFEKASLKKRGIIIVMIIIVFILMVGTSIKNLGDIGTIILILCMLGVLLLLLYNKPNAYTIALTSLGFEAVAFLCVATDINSGRVYLMKLVIESICMVSLIIFLGIIKKRNQYGNEMLGKIRGFKNFLQIAEKPMLEELVMKDPEYFYNILPYTYVLGVSDKWINKFEDIVLEEPSWYHGYDAFNIHAFNMFTDSTYSSIYNAMCSKPHIHRYGIFI